MAPAWEQVASEWENHDIGFVGEVDCTAPESESLCEVFQVEAFPTILYGDPSSPEEYQGGRDYESLSAFAKANIGKAVCSLGKLDACDPEDKKLVEELKGKSKEELMETAAKVDEKIAEAQTELDEYIEKINEEYEAQTAKFNSKVETLKAEANYKWLKQILQVDHGVSIGGGGHDDEDDMEGMDEEDDIDPLDDDDLSEEL